MQAHDRVRDNTSSSTNIEFDREMLARIQRLSEGGPSAAGEHITRLEKEWDIERALETNASIFASAGLALGVLHSQWWLVLPAIVLFFLFQHAVQGWCPPLPILRRIGFRTRKEIDQEKFALKALRGDFSGIGPDTSARSALRAAAK